MTIILFLGTIIVACGVAFAVNTALVHAFDPRGREARARATAKSAAAAARESSRRAFIKNLGNSISELLPFDRTRENELSMRLARAGMHITPSTYWGIVIISALAGILVGLAIALIANVSITARVAIAAVTMVLGLVAPRFITASKARKRAEVIEASLPGTLELLSVIVEAGQTIERGIREIAERTDGPLAEEFQHVNLDITRYNRKTSDALADMATRCNLKSVGLFCSSVSQALEQGSAIGRILKMQATIASENYYMSVEEKSNKITVKMSIATIFFLLPPVIIISIGPAIINMLTSATGFFG